MTAFLFFVAEDQGIDKSVPFQLSCADVLSFARARSN